MAEIMTAIKVRPRLAFVGVGWIGLNRLKALTDNDLCEPVAIIEPVASNVQKAQELAPDARVLSMDELAESSPDGVVIATPSAMHARQSILALEKGMAVFCQKPLARTAEESRQVIKAAQQADRLLGVDFSYRYTGGIQKIHQLAHQDTLGKIFAVDLVFHNAYGPDKPWFYDPSLSGGGCLIDLGIHLVDLALWMLDFPDVTSVSSSLMSGGQPLQDSSRKSEDFVFAQFETAQGTNVRLTCSWNLSAGKDAEIKAAFYGTKASACFSNVNGSFYDFQTTLCRGTSFEIISLPGEDWGGRALKEWAAKLGISNRFDPGILNYLKVAETIDKIYGR